MIFFDEMTFLEDWRRAAKERIDNGKLRHDVVTVTGSASPDLLKQKERPGRRGNCKDVVRHHRTFSQYMGIMSGIRSATVTSIDELERAMKENAIYTETLPLSMESCMKTVGFPKAIIAAKEKRKLRDVTVKPFLDSVRSDWAKARRNDRYVKELIGYMLQARGTALSWLSIPSDTSLASPPRAQSYIETLERLLVAAVLELILPQ